MKNFELIETLKAKRSKLNDSLTWKQYNRFISDFYGTKNGENIGLKKLIKSNIAGSKKAVAIEILELKRKFK